MEEKNCPFYGRHMAFMMDLPDLAEMLDPRPSEMMRPDIAPFNLIAQGGNEFALISGSFSPYAKKLTDGI
jgi:hypothetical protein